MPSETATLGDLRVRRLGFGAMKLTGRGTWGPPPDVGAAVELVRLARELGTDFFDTADAYGPDVSEQILRDALHPYDDVVVATKGGHTRQGPSLWRRDGRPQALRAACHGSLRRLGVDRIDLYQLHAVDPDVPLEESLGALVDLRSAGLVRHVGICNVTTDELERALAVGPVVSVQNRYSVGDRSSEDVLAACERLGLAFVPWGPLGQGRLPHARGDLARVARRHGVSRAEVALGWLLHRSSVTIPIPGTRSAAHLRANSLAPELRLTPEDIDALERPTRVARGVKDMARASRARIRRARALRRL